MASRPFKSALNNGLLQRVNSCPSLIPRSGPRQDRASGPGLPRAHALRPDDLFTPEDRAYLRDRLPLYELSFSLVLPPSYVGEAIVRLRRGDSRASRFWEKLLDEVERANSAWSIARAYIAVLVAQTTLAAWAFAALASAPARLAVLAVNAVACVWCVTVAFEMLHGRYTAVDADEQELHDLLGGRSPWRHQPPSG
ncbi:hypothetical protein HIM_03251 [Hirsutella minnesotensis 3608]|nr:hypothetical protein HIM_03251 [Hirsutella minnesotensis 3608]